MLNKLALKKLKITTTNLFYTTPDFAAVKAEKAAQVALQLEQHRANYNPVLNELLITKGHLKTHYLSTIQKYSGTKVGNVVDIVKEAIASPTNSNLLDGEITTFLEEVDCRAQNLIQHFPAVSEEQRNALVELRNAGSPQISQPLRELIARDFTGSAAHLSTCKQKIVEISSEMAKYIENVNIADLVDLGCFYQLNQPLTGLVMDHYIVIMIGGGLFLDNYVIIHLYQQQIFQHLTNSQIQKFCIQRALEERVFSYPRFIVASGTFLSLLLFSRSGIFLTAPEPSTMYNLGATLSQGTVDFSRGWASNFGSASTACQDGFNLLSKTLKVLWRRG